MLLLKKRTRYDIIAEIVKVSEGGASLGSLMYKVKITRKDLKNYLEYCTANGLIRGTALIHTTPKGCRFLEIYERLMTLFEDSEALWKKRKEWLKQRFLAANRQERAKWEKTLRQTIKKCNKSRTEKVLELLLSMSEHPITA